MVDVLEEHVVFIGHGHEGPWNQSRCSVVLYHLGCSYESLPAERFLYEHVDVIGNI